MFYLLRTELRNAPVLTELAVEITSRRSQRERCGSRQVVGKGFFYEEFYGGDRWYIYYTVIIETKDGKARVTFKDFLWKSMSIRYTPVNLKAYPKSKVKIDQFTDKAISDYEDFLEPQTTVEW